MLQDFVLSFQWCLQPLRQTLGLTRGVEDFKKQRTRKALERRVQETQHSLDDISMNRCF